jgi:two-component system sensor histidine kinase SenX3
MPPFWRRQSRSANHIRQDAATRVSELEHDREALESILSALDEGIVLFDPDGRVLYQNGAAARLLGTTVRDAHTLVPQGLREAVRGATKGDGVQAIELPAGEPARILRVSARAVREQEGVLLLLRDVTEARRVEAVRRDFVANASHELKTPVAAIQALAETIGSAATEDPEAVPRFVQQLERESRRLARVVADLLDLSRLEGAAVERSEVRFDRLAADEAERYRRRAERAGVTLRVDTNGPVSVTGSARDLGLLIRNLVENAIHYTRPGGSVSVSVGRDDRGRAMLEVRDSGIGIPSKEQSRIFERFYRVDRARSRETGGTGLGLSIVRHVAENHGGTVAVDSEVGRGSTFVVRLPARPS